MNWLGGPSSELQIWKNCEHVVQFAAPLLGALVSFLQSLPPSLRTASEQHLLPSVLLSSSSGGVFRLWIVTQVGW